MDDQASQWGILCAPARKRKTGRCPSFSLFSAVRVSASTALKLAASSYPEVLLRSPHFCPEFRPWAWRRGKAGNEDPGWTCPVNFSPQQSRVYVDQEPSQQAWQDLIHAVRNDATHKKKLEQFLSTCSCIGRCRSLACYTGQGRFSLQWHQEEERGWKDWLLSYFTIYRCVCHLEMDSDFLRLRGQQTILTTTKPHISPHSRREVSAY